MARHVALIRGLNNIGSAKRVAMADLRALFEGLGFRDVTTRLNSGNVVFSARNQRRSETLDRIEAELSARLGLSGAVTLLSGDEVVAVVRDNPFAKIASNPSHLLVVVPWSTPDRKRLEPLLERRWAPEALALGRRVAYLWCARGVARSPVWAAAGRALERRGTARNMATMTKLLAEIRSPR